MSPFDTERSHPISIPPRRGTGASTTAGRARVESTPRRIVRPGSNTWREVRAEDSGVIVDAADYYRAFYRSAREARRSILMSGWQFDSGVELLRGRDALPGREVRLLRFLNQLCEENENLRVHILAWDFHIVFAGEREWMQRVYFHWMTNTRFQFLFDDCPLPGGSHHQKFVVIDGVVSYLGGMDVCESRWDDRHHHGRNSLRGSRGRPSMPYHDVQAYLAGRRVGSALEDLFWERWTNAGGEKPDAGVAEEPARPFRPRGLIPLGPARIALSRTEPCPPERPTIREIERLLVDAIESARGSIYVETQYFSSHRLCRAFEERMRDAGKPRLRIVVVVNERAEKLKEEIAVGLRQAENLEHLRRVAAETGHDLGLYYSLCEGVTEDFRATYIHSKVMIVDDRFLTVGSANFTNRSMGLDSELHASWEAAPGDARLVRRIRRVRVSLLAEHGGLSGVRAVRKLWAPDELVAHLDEFASGPGARLQRHGPPTPVQAAVMSLIDPKDLPFDPEMPECGEPEEGEGVAAGSARPWLSPWGAATAVWQLVSRLASQVSPVGSRSAGDPVTR